MTETPTRPTLDQIGDLLAWCRRLSEAGPGRVDPAELAAYQAAKTKLLARITNHPHTHTEAGGA